MRESGLVAVVRLTLRTRESLAVPGVRGQVIGMQTLLWPDELRGTEDIAVPCTGPPRRQELQMARSLMNAVTPTSAGRSSATPTGTPWSRSWPPGWRAWRSPHAPDTVPIEGSGVVDLMAALERSVEIVFSLLKPCRSEPQ